MAEEREKRNIVKIKMRRLNIADDDGSPNQPKSLTMEDVSVLIFYMIKIKPEDCLGVPPH